MGFLLKALVFVVGAAIVLYVAIVLIRYLIIPLLVH